MAASQNHARGGFSHLHSVKILKRCEISLGLRSRFSCLVWVDSSSSLNVSSAEKIDGTLPEILS